VLRTWLDLDQHIGKLLVGLANLGVDLHGKLLHAANVRSTLTCMQLAPCNLPEPLGCHGLLDAVHVLALAARTEPAQERQSPRHLPGWSSHSQAKLSNLPFAQLQASLLGATRPWLREEQSVFAP
jgi:hypothetical protein